MIQITNKTQCCGCEACVQICPKHCVSFGEDKEGFQYPEVDLKECIDCGLCEKVCPVLNRGTKREPLHSYASKNPNEDERLKSSSGGIFILLAKKILADGGVVFGARFDEGWNVIHSYTETQEGVKPFMGSKYVQSRIGNSYIKVREFIRAGRKVLFSGTPCQVAGLRNFLKKEYDNLLTVDLICHGVPSPSVWREYMAELKVDAQRAKNSVSSPLIRSIAESDAPTLASGLEIRGISFRDKRFGWKKFSFVLTLAEAMADGNNNTVSFSNMHDDDPYFLGFNDYNLYLRPSCMQCPTRDLRSGSDITLADFWGIETLLPELDDDKGVSVIMANTAKGYDFVQSLDIELHNVKFTDIESRNSSIKKNSVPLNSSILDTLRYRVRLKSKRDYFFFDKVHSVSEKVKILSYPGVIKSIKGILKNIYRNYIQQK